jgi:hypothetical protein
VGGLDDAARHSRRHWSTRRAKYGMAANDSGTAAASGPIEVPTMSA